MQDQLDKYIAHFDCQRIENAMNRLDLDREVSFDDLYASGEVGLDEMLELCGR